MRYSLSFSLLAAITATITATTVLGIQPNAQADELFSQVTMQSVFAESHQEKKKLADEQTARQSTEADRIANLQKLFDLPAEESTTQTATEDEPSIVGRWSATTASGNVFAIEMTQDSSGKNQFKLVHLNHGKVTQSSGTFSLQGGALALSSPGGTSLASQIEWSGSDRFEMQIGVSTVAFKRAE